jgi:hypothetical protein
MAGLEKKYKKKAKRAGQRAASKSFFGKGETMGKSQRDGKKAVVKKSFKAGASRGAATTARTGQNSITFTRRKNLIGKVAGSVGKVYKMTAKHKAAISKALKGKKRS